MVQTWIAPTRVPLLFGYLVSGFILPVLGLLLLEFSQSLSSPFSVVTQALRPPSSFSLQSQCIPWSVHPLVRHLLLSAALQKLLQSYSVWPVLLMQQKGSFSMTMDHATLFSHVPNDVPSC